MNKSKKPYWCDECIRTGLSHLGLEISEHGNNQKVSSLSDLKIRITQTSRSSVYLHLVGLRANYQLRPCKCGRMIYISYQPEGCFDSASQKELDSPFGNHSEIDSQENRQNQCVPLFEMLEPSLKTKTPRQRPS